MANQEAARLNHEYIGTEHVLLGLIRETNGLGAAVLLDLDVDLNQLRAEVEKFIKVGREMVTRDRVPQTPRVKMVVMYAIEESKQLGQDYVGTEHLLLGLLRDQLNLAGLVLKHVGVELEAARQKVIEIQKKQGGESID